MPSHADLLMAPPVALVVEGLAAVAAGVGLDLQVSVDVRLEVVQVPEGLAANAARPSACHAVVAHLVAAQALGAVKDLATAVAGLASQPARIWMAGTHVASRVGLAPCVPAVGAAPVGGRHPDGGKADRRGLLGASWEGA